MNDMIACRTLFNETKLIPRKKLRIRPSAYGIVIRDGQLLVAKTRTTASYILPGGGIEKGESNEEAVRREVCEETGVDVTVNAMVHFQTDFFYYDPLDLALHGFLFYYTCTPHSEINQPPQPEIEDVVSAHWVDIDTLTPESFQTHGDVIVGLIQQKTV